MTVSPLTILDRLISENLHGPTIPFNPNSSAAAKANSLNFDQWVLIGDEYTDLDAKDPRCCLTTFYSSSLITSICID
ncbi:hypothetical protein BATDEDRAFT_91307 [Batrachochytrium dendrobatidis JAM81]|uniref:Uncharacterized protein n=1 Tax=Batrachochytrium dendrobatidis (strain JAM81 / FGSC 10211) TaxID=684364 RepID=F4PAA3_BATDJ|nr:uncharacterized protein BATDEDRAFT_91307 [Batrachochytrium dendrobatidis JAM81]EGF77892.1 hypothetical protein BATDEDRAFT_91307 [Batrachochytrium dendrobatidis JAM81]|eukprot:XP_006681500.1 hypothetical protein BATDEDRAFT_91307 [Batrachochytrium dendrobatidis JAM81]